MSVTFNSADAMRQPGCTVGSDAARDKQPSKDGLLISPESSRPARSQVLARLTLFLLGLGLVAATIVFVAALIAIALA
jgi:hypothetical protein